MNKTLTYQVSIFIAGDYSAAKQLISKFAFDKGLCVTTFRTDFVYSGGVEEGIEVRFQNYPRFPSEPSEMDEKAEALAVILMDGLYQRTSMIVNPVETTWLQNANFKQGQPA